MLEIKNLIQTKVIAQSKSQFTNFCENPQFGPITNSKQSLI